MNCNLFASYEKEQKVTYAQAIQITLPIAEQ